MCLLLARSQPEETITGHIGKRPLSDPIVKIHKESSIMFASCDEHKSFTWFDGVVGYHVCLTANPVKGIKFAEGLRFKSGSNQDLF